MKPKRGCAVPYPARGVGDSCDGCASQEGRHYCLLHSRQMKNMDTLRCDDFTPRERPCSKEDNMKESVDEVVNHLKGDDIISLGHGAHIRINTFVVKKETSDRLDIAVQVDFFGGHDTVWYFPKSFYFSYTKGEPYPVIRKYGPECNRPKIIGAEMLGFYLKEYLKKNYRDLYKKYMFGSKGPSVYKKVNQKRRK
jgi:hypothetical protein